jgi:YaiO family outer membrane protein
VTRLRTGLSALAILAALLFGAVAAAAAATNPPVPAPTTDLELGATYESLTNGFPAWSSQYLLFTKKYDAQRVDYAEVDDVSRFSKHDVQLTLGAYFPLGARWAGFAEGSFSPTYRVLPSNSIAAGATYNSGSKWYEGVTLRHTGYASTNVNSTALSLEHYWASFRIAYSVTAAHLQATGTDVDHSIELDRYYGEKNSYVGIGYTFGREVENVGLPALLVSNVNGLSISGRHWTSDRWAIAYGLESFKQGASYTRSGGHLGLDYRL